MKKPAPNFLTCPAAAELPPPRESGDSSVASKPPAGPAGKPKKKIKLFLMIVLFALLGLAIFLIPPTYAFGKALLAGRDVKTALDTLKINLEQGDYEAAQDEAGRARAALDIFRNSLQGVGFFRDLPYVGTQVRALQDVAAVGVHSLDSLEDLLHVAVAMSDALQSAGVKPEVGVADDRSWQDLSPQEKRGLLSALDKSLPEIRLARDKIDLALALWQDIPQDRLLPSMRQALNPVAELLPVMRLALDQSVPLLEAAIPLAGYPAPVEYLVVLQNSDEMRPSGGFIGNVGKIKIDAGEITDFQFTDVYNIDNPVSGVWNETPPEPLAKHLGVKAWFMRDANWSPDFVESASRVLDFFIRETALLGLNENPQGVVALQPEFFRRLLRLTGPISVGGQTYDHNNFMDLIEYEVEIGFLQQGIKVEDRKALINEIGIQLSQKIQALPRSEWPKLINLVSVALDEKQIMIYARDPSLQSLVDKRDWSGRAKPTVCDFLWVVDANLAALKTDGKMVKGAVYQLDARDPNKPLATLKLKYQNTTSKIDWRYTRYRSYTRVYVPEGSTFMSSSGAMQGDLLQTGGRFVPGKVDIMKELGKTVFGAFWAIESGKTGELSFTYALPAEASACLSRGEYVLDWLKQPGVDQLQMEVEILLPGRVLEADPPEADTRWGDAVYQVEADSRDDQRFKVKF